MQVKINTLKGKIVENGYTGTDFAKLIGIDPSTYYRKLGEGGGSFTIAQIQKMTEILSLSKDECMYIFFNQLLA